MDVPTAKRISISRALIASKLIETDGQPAEVAASGVFIGSIGAASNKERLKELGITHILRVCEWQCFTFPQDFIYKRLAIKDHPSANIGAHFEACAQFIDEALSQESGPILLPESISNKDEAGLICNSHSCSDRNGRGGHHHSLKETSLTLSHTSKQSSLPTRDLQAESIQEEGEVNLQHEQPGGSSAKKATEKSGEAQRAGCHRGAAHRNAAPPPPPCRCWESGTPRSPPPPPLPAGAAAATGEAAARGGGGGGGGGGGARGGGGGRVLVHCVAGRSRSAAVVAAYLMLRRRRRLPRLGGGGETISMESALALVRAARPEAEPNPGFCIQLRMLERYLHTEKFQPKGSPSLEGGMHHLPAPLISNQHTNNFDNNKSDYYEGENHHQQQQKTTDSIDHKTNSSTSSFPPRFFYWNLAGVAHCTKCLKPVQSNLDYSCINCYGGGSSRSNSDNNNDNNSADVETTT